MCVCVCGWMDAGIDCGACVEGLFRCPSSIKIGISGDKTTSACHFTVEHSGDNGASYFFLTGALVVALAGAAEAGGGRLPNSKGTVGPA